MSPPPGRVADLGVLPALAVPKEYQVTGQDPDDLPGGQTGDLPPGWTAIRQRSNAWSLYCRGEFACELARSLVGEWRLCLPGEYLPRPSAYATPAAAVAALLRVSRRPAIKPSPRERRAPVPEPAPTTPRPVLSSYFRHLHPHRADPDHSHPSTEPPSDCRGAD